MSDSRLDAKANRILHRNNPQEIVKALADLEEHRAEFATRWLWELIQNARDFPDESRPMTIRISVSPERITFAHNGRDFTEDEILAEPDRGQLFAGRGYRLAEHASLLLKSLAMETPDVSLMFDMSFMGLTESYNADLTVNWSEVLYTLDHAHLRSTVLTLGSHSFDLILCVFDLGSCVFDLCSCLFDLVLCSFTVVHPCLCFLHSHHS